MVLVWFSATLISGIDASHLDVLHLIEAPCASLTSIPHNSKIA